MLKTRAGDRGRGQRARRAGAVALGAVASQSNFMELRHGRRTARRGESGR